MFHQFFFSPQEKRYTIISYKHGIYELPHKLPNDLRLRKLGNTEKVSKLHNGLVPSSPTKMKILLIPAKCPRKTETKLFPECAISSETSAILQYFVNDYSYLARFTDCIKAFLSNNFTFLILLN